MYTNVSISKTIPVTGICSMDNETKEINVTYKKYHPLGETNAFAIVTGIDCMYADGSCTAEQCPIAYSRVYW